MRRTAARPDVRSAIYFTAIAVLGVGLWLAIRALPPDVRLENWGYVLLSLLVGAPIAIALNAIETELSARLLGLSFGWRRALRVSILSSAANALPLPGGPMVRTAALNDLGAGMARSGGVVAAVAMAWAGLTFVYAGGWLVALDRIWVGAAFFCAGAGGLGASIGWMRLLQCSSRLIALVCTVKILASAVGVMRLWWAFAALGAFLSLGEASVFIVAAVTGTAVSFVPAGLGVTETVSAGLATAILISPATAFIAATVNRIISLCVIIPCALTALVLGRGQARRVSQRYPKG